LAAKDQQLQRTLYAAHMNLAHNAFEAGAPGRLRELLAQHRPQPGEADLRGFEWHYLNRLFPADLLVLEHVGLVTSVAYSPDGKRLATGSVRGQMAMWDAQTGERLLTLEGHSASIRCLAFSPDGKRLASASPDKTVTLWDAESGQLLHTLQGHADHVLGIAF